MRLDNRFQVISALLTLYQMQLSKSLFLRDEHRHFLRVECSLSDWFQKPVSFTAKHKYLDRVNKEKYTLLYLCK